MVTRKFLVGKQQLLNRLKAKLCKKRFRDLALAGTIKLRNRIRPKFAHMLLLLRCIEPDNFRSVGLFIIF
jgi:hypothetical protein